MRTKFTLMALLAGGLVASAAPATLSITKVSDDAQLLQRAASKSNITQQAAFSLKSQASQNLFAAPQRVAGAYGEELEPIINEDFSLMNTGSIDEPDWSASLIKMPGDADYEYFWNNMKDGYTHTTGWGGQFIYPAGGHVYLDANSSTQQAGIVTPRVDISANGGVAVLRFKARTLDGITSDYLLVEAAETNNWGPSWDVLASGLCPTVTDEWQTFEVVVQNGGPTTLFSISANGAIEVILDDIQIFQYDLYVGIPTLNEHTNYLGTSFDLSWSAVEGADSYLVNLYSVNEMTGEVSYLYKDEPVSENSWTATGTESGLTYYYTVRAVKGEYIGIESLPVEIYDLVAPVLGDASAIAEDGTYSVSWSEVPSAGVYNYWAYADRVAAEDGAFVLTNESFTGLTESDGSEVTRSIEKPDWMVYDEYFPKEVNQGGWKLRNGAPCTGYVVLDAWHYINGNGDAGLISPELDLSKNNGVITIDLSLWGDLTEGYDWEDNLREFQTECAVALFTYDEELGDYKQAELIYISDVEEAWNDYQITISGGTERSIIGFYAVRAEGNLYIDNLKITQDYKAGESFRDPFKVVIFHPETEIEVVVPPRAANANIYHKVCAVKGRRGSDGINETLNTKESEFSELKFVGQAPMTSIENAFQINSSARVVSGELSIANPAAEVVNVFDLSGRLIYSDASGNQNISLNLTQNGIYIVKVGNKTIKVIR